MAPGASTGGVEQPVTRRRLPPTTSFRALRGLLAVLRAAISTLVVLLFGYMVVAVLVQVIGRYVFNFSIAGAVETATFAQIWMAMLAAGYAMRRGWHVNVDFVVRKLPPRVVVVLDLLIAGVCLWFLWVVFVGSFRLIEIGKIQTSAALLIPMLYPYLAIPAAAVYFALEFVLFMWGKYFGDPDAGSAGPEAVL